MLYIHGVYICVYLCRLDTTKGTCLRLLTAAAKRNTAMIARMRSMAAYSDVVKTQAETLLCVPRKRNEICLDQSIQSAFSDSLKILSVVCGLGTSRSGHGRRHGPQPNPADREHAIADDMPAVECAQASHELCRSPAAVDSFQRWRPAASGPLARRAT